MCEALRAQAEFLDFTTVKYIMILSPKSITCSWQSIRWRTTQRCLYFSSSFLTNKLSKLYAFKLCTHSNDKPEITPPSVSQGWKTIPYTLINSLHLPGAISIFMGFYGINAAENTKYCGCTMTSKMPHRLKTPKLIAKWKVFPISCAYICT